MSDLINYPIRRKRRRPILKNLVAMVCAMAMMLGSGYIGARIAGGQDSSLRSNTETAQTQHASDASADHSFDLLHSAQAGENLSLTELFAGANPAVVAISTEVTGHNIFGQTVTRPSAGSGFLISPNGYIVTNDHVIEHASSVTVLMYDGSEHPATVIGRDPESDLAVIQIEGSDWQHLRFGDSDSLQVGEQVAAIGNPLGALANSMTVGHISAFDRDINIDGVSRNKLQTDAAVNSGNSGGPLLNLRGEVIGVVSAKSMGMGVEGLGFAIPSSQAEIVVGQLTQYGHVRGRAILGVQVTASEGSGYVQVAYVNRGSAAERAGILPGDIILSADGVMIASFADLRAVLDTQSPNDRIEIRVQRDGAAIALTATLDEYRPVGF